MTANAVFSLELAGGALTRWEGFFPVCLCHHGDGVMASDGTGLSRLSGDADDETPIPVRISLPATDCDAPGPKRLTGLRLTGVLSGPVMVEARSDTGSRLSGEAAPAGRDGLVGQTLARLGRGHGRFWRIDLTAGDGAPLDIAAIELVYTSLDRREN